MPLRSVELFAGIGGFRLAADQLGLSTVWANDNSALAASVYAAAFPGSPFRHGPIEQLLDEVPDHDVLTGGFPCQPYSSAGKKLGLGDPRATTVQAVLKIAAANRPPVIVLENVPNLLAVSSGRHLRHVVDQLAALDYDVEWRIVNAADVGLPQYRARLVLLALQHHPGQPALHLTPDETPPLDRLEAFHAQHGRPLPSWGLLRHGRLRCLDDKPKRENPSWGRLRLTDHLQADVDDRYDFTDATLARLPASTRIGRTIRGVEVLYNQAGGSRMGYTVYGTGGLAPTLTCTASRHYERFQVGERFRRLTPVEYARLQGFPDQHCQQAPHHQQYALYGNAIPPPLACFALERALQRRGERPLVDAVA